MFPLRNNHRNFTRPEQRSASRDAGRASRTFKAAQLANNGIDFDRKKNPSSPRPISTGLLRALLRFQIRPINLVVYQGSYSLNGDGRAHLEAGFPLRCLQRLSDPDVANLRCPWQDNRYTRGPFIPVLSY